MYRGRDTSCSERWPPSSRSCFHSLGKRAAEPTFSDIERRLNHRRHVRPATEATAATVVPAMTLTGVVVEFSDDVTAGGGVCDAAVGDVAAGVETSRTKLADVVDAGSPSALVEVVVAVASREVGAGLPVTTMNLVVMATILEVLELLVRDSSSKTQAEAPRHL